MMIVDTQADFKGAIDNSFRNGENLVVTGYPSCVSFDMIGLWFLTIETDYDTIVARNERMHG